MMLPDQHASQDADTIDNTQPACSQHYDEKEVVPGDGLQAVPGEGLEAVQPQTPTAGQTFAKRKTALAIAVIGILVLVGIIVGSVVGTRHREGAPPSTEPVPTVTAASTTAILPVPSPSIHSRAISTVKWSDGKGLHNIRLYYIANSGEVTEAINRTDGGWDHQGLGFRARDSSSVAAAVTQPNYPLNLDPLVFPSPDPPPAYPLKIHVFYIDSQDVVQQIIFQNNSWSLGSLDSLQLVASSNSSLAAVIGQCAVGCENLTSVAFQDPTQTVRIANLASNGWSLYDLDASVVSGTPLVLQQFYDAIPSLQLDLYYQHTNLSLVKSSWNSSLESSGWSAIKQVFGSIPSAAPVAVYSTYSNQTSAPPSKVQGNIHQTYWTEIYFYWVTKDGINITNWSSLAIVDGHLSGDPSWDVSNTGIPAVAEAGTNHKTYRFVASTGDYIFGSMILEGQSDSITVLNYDIGLRDWRESPAIKNISGWV